MKKFLLLTICLFLVITEVFCQGQKTKVRLHKYVGTAATYSRHFDEYYLTNAHLTKVVFLEKDELKLLASKINRSPDIVNIELDGPYSGYSFPGGEYHDKVDTTWEKIWYLDSNLIYRERPYCRLEFGETVRGDDNKSIIGRDQFTLIDGEYVFQFQIDFSDGRIYSLLCSKNGKGFCPINFVGHDCTNTVSFNRWLNIGFKRNLLNHIKKEFILAIK